MTQAVRRERLERQRLIGEPFPSAAACVRTLCAIQSQDLLGALWAVGMRTGLDRTAVERAYDAGEILRTHVLRPTWHFVLPEDLGWLQALTSPRVHRANASVYRRCDLDAKTLARGASAIERALADGPLTRTELSTALKKAKIPAEKVRLACLVMYAELEALIASGPMRGKQTTYMLAERRAPRGAEIERDEALGRLVRRYFDGHGPATVKDCAWWSGLAAKDVLRGIDIARIEKRGEIWSTPHTPSRARSAGVRLLSNYDEYAIAYQDRGAFFDPEAIAKIGGEAAGALRSSADGVGAPAEFTSAGGGGAQPPRKTSAPAMVLASHLVISDGVLIGGWKRTIAKKHARVEARVLATAGLDEATATFGRFLGLETTWVAV